MSAILLVKDETITPHNIGYPPVTTGSNEVVETAMAVALSTFLPSNIPTYSLDHTQTIRYAIPLLHQSFNFIRSLAILSQAFGSRREFF